MWMNWFVLLKKIKSTSPSLIQTLNAKKKTKKKCNPAFFIFLCGLEEGKQQSHNCNGNIHKYVYHLAMVTGEFKQYNWSQN